MNELIDYKIDVGIINGPDELELSSKIEEDELDYIQSIVSDNIKFNSHHELSNRWAPYRLFRLLCELEQSKTSFNDVDIIRDEICQLLFFKKLVLKECYQDLKSKDHSKTIKQFKIKHNSIISQKPKVGIIEDELYCGWDHAYNSLFGVENCDYIYPQLSYSELQDDEIRKDNFLRFLDQINSNTLNLSHFDIILLDLRLWEHSKNDSSDILELYKLSGIKTLNAIKKLYSTLPVIICTASNKAWSYEEAIDAGASGYWTKESPEFGISIDYNLSISFQFVCNVDDALKWSSEVNGIFDTLTNFVEITKSNSSVSKRFEMKKDIIFGQLHKRSNKYLQSYYGQSGYEFSFLTCWSLLKEVIDFVTIIEKPNGEEIYTFQKDDTEIMLIHSERGRFFHPFNQNKEIKGHFPETLLLQVLINKRPQLFDDVNYRNIMNKNFTKIRDIRNRLNVTHGHISNVTIKNIKEILSIYYYVIVGKSCSFLHY